MYSGSLGRTDANIEPSPPSILPSSVTHSVVSIEELYLPTQKGSLICATYIIQN